MASNATECRCDGELMPRWRGPEVMDDDLTRRAREELERRRKRRALDELLKELRELHPIRIHESGLSFDYVP